MAAKIYPIPPANADFATTWAFLKDGLGDIMTEPQTGMSPHRYMALSTASYNHCTSPSPIPGRADIMGSDLYNNIVRFLVTHLKTLKDALESLQDEALLQYYATEWDRYTKGANQINRLFTYLNRGWVKREMDEGRKGIYPIYTLCLVQWKTNVFIPVQNTGSRLTGPILRLIERQRNGQEIDEGLVKKVVGSFVSLGFDEDDINRVRFDVYRNHFEIPFLRATEVYYKPKSKAFLAENSISDYLKKAEEWLREEEGRVEKYFNTETRKPLIRSCMHVLIREHFELMYKTSQSLFDHDGDEDIRRMYGFLARNPDDLESLRSEFEENVKRAGLTAVLRLVGKGGAIITEVDPKAYVDALFEVHRKSSGMVEWCFRSEAGMIARLDNVYRDFINENAATGGLGTKSPELLAEYADALLRRGNKMAEEDLDSALHRVAVVFRYLVDKNVFRIFYATKLAKRLIHGLSVSEEAETSMISKLREVSDPGYTHKLERMFTDVSLSRVITDKFRERVTQDHGDTDIDFSIMTLGTNFWPLGAPDGGFNIPAEISPLYDRFSEYYRREHHGKNLVWLWDHSQNELRTNYLDREYTLITSSYQMAILLQYNDRDTSTLDELVIATAIDKYVVMWVLAGLVKDKILIKKAKNRYELNLGFKSNRIRVDLNLPTKADVRAESVRILRTVNENRKYTLQSTIYCILRAHRTMKHQELIQEVVSQVSRQFVATVLDINKTIDLLVYKECIERVEGTLDMYKHIPIS